MATTTIRLKRSTSNKTGIVLKRGEPFYNTTTKKLYIGNSEDESLATKKAITDITSLSIFKTFNMRLSRF